MKKSKLDQVSSFGAPSVSLAALHQNISGGEEGGGSKNVIYTTNEINKILDSISSGAPKVDYKPFYKRNTELRAANILFEMTDWESEEFDRCMVDAIYFTEKYVKFKTDYGRTNVTLRDYQKEVIELITSEVYDEEKDLCIPKNRDVILMQSRQTGKCVTYDSKVKLAWEIDSVCIGDLYHRYRRKSFLDYVRGTLLFIYNKL